MHDTSWNGEDLALSDGLGLCREAKGAARGLSADAGATPRRS